MFSSLSQEMKVEDLKDEPPTPDGCPVIDFRVHAVDLAKKNKSTKLFETTAQLPYLIKIFSIKYEAKWRNLIPQSLRMQIISRNH
jgi:hypothetical protein